MEEEKKTSTKKRTTKPKATSSSTKKVSKTKAKETPKKSSYDIWMNIINCMEVFYNNYLTSKDGVSKYEKDIRRYRFYHYTTTVFGCFIIGTTIGNMVSSGLKTYDLAFLSIAVIILLFKRIIFKMLKEAITGEADTDFYENKHYKELKRWTDIPYFKDFDFKKVIECMYFCVYFNQIYSDKLSKIKETTLYKSTRSLTIKELEEVVQNGRFNDGMSEEDYKICSYYLLCRPEISLINMIINNPLFIRTRDWCNLNTYDDKKFLSSNDYAIIHNMTLDDNIEQIGEKPDLTELNMNDFHSYFGLGISTFDKMMKLHLPEFNERVNEMSTKIKNSPFKNILQSLLSQKLENKFGQNKKEENYGAYNKK